ncbi:MAG: hypothetical protein MK101_02665 [Phycisphaerales bacterium]|nr:hypothetical protein [Phycisphaerales bacterium]
MRRRPAQHPRGVALLLVLVAMAAATTLVMGWLAVGDTSPLVGRNAVRAAEARATAHAGLELAVAVLETDAPWREQHDNGWIMRSHPIAGGSVDVRLWDGSADVATPPSGATTHVVIEATATVDGLAQTMTANATVHPFDGGTPGDLDGMAMHAQESLRLAGQSRIRSWRRGSTRRMIGIANDDPGSVELRGASARQGTAGADLILPAGAPAGVVTGSGRGGLARSRRQRPMPDAAGEFGLQRSDLPTLEGLMNHEDGLVINSRIAWELPSDALHIAGDLIIREQSHMVIPAGSTLRIAGDLILEHGSAMSVAPGAEATVIIGGDCVAQHATIGSVQPARRRRNKPRQADPTNLRLVADPTDEAQWRLLSGTVVSARIDAPNTELEMRNATIVGRVAAHEIECTDTRLWYDHALATGAGLAALARTVDRLDLLDRRNGGLEGPAMSEVLDRLIALVHPSNLRQGRPVAPPSGDLWLMRPVLVDAQMNRFGGDTAAWEQAAMASVDGAAQ